MLSRFRFLIYPLLAACAWASPYVSGPVGMLFVAPAAAQAVTVRAGRLDESGFGFVLTVPDDWSADIEAEDGPVLNWRLNHKDWLAGGTPSGLAFLSVSVLEPDAGQDTEKAFRSFVAKYAQKYLGNGEVLSVEAFRFGQYSGFDARVEGFVVRQGGKTLPVSVRLFLYLTVDREVIVSALAPRGHARLLDGLGAPGSLIESATEDQGAVTATDPGASAGEAPAADAGAAKPGSEAAGLKSPASTTRETIIPDAAGRFRPFAWGGGVLEEFGTFNADGLTIRIPADAATGGDGVASTGTLINLGDLDAGAATEIQLSFDPVGTDNALVILCPGRFVPCLSEPSFHAVLQPSGFGTKLSLTHEGQPLGEALLDGMPDHLGIRVDRDGIYVFPSNGDAMMVGRPPAFGPFAGLEMLVASVPLPGGSKLMLRSASILSTHGSRAAAPLPEPDQGAQVFPPSGGQEWSELAVNGGDFASMARLENGQLDVRVLPGNLWGHTGLVSAQPLFRLAEPDEPGGPARLHGVVDPSVAALSFAVSLLPDAGSDLWLGSFVHAQFSRNEDGTFRAGLNVCASSTRAVEMVLDREWPGDFDLTVTTQRVELAAGGRRVETLLACGLPELKGHVAIFAAPLRQHDPAALTLLGLAIDRLPGADDGLPYDGSEQPDAGFDPATWIEAAKADFKESAGAP